MTSPWPPIYVSSAAQTIFVTLKIGEVGAGGGRVPLALFYDYTKSYPHIGFHIEAEEKLGMIIDVSYNYFIELEK